MKKDKAYELMLDWPLVPRLTAHAETRRKERTNLTREQVQMGVSHRQHRTPGAIITVLPTKHSQLLLYRFRLLFRDRNDPNCLYAVRSGDNTKYVLSLETVSAETKAKCVRGAVFSAAVSKNGKNTLHGATNFTAPPEKRGKEL